MFFKKKKDVSQATVRKSVIREWAEALIVAMILAFIIRSFLFQAFKIPSGSMLDTLLIGDHLLVNKFIYGTQIPFSDERFLALRQPERGDVIVFEFPEDEGKSYFDRRDFIKRVVGVPGDVVEVKDKQLYVNGKPLIIRQAVYKDTQTVPAVAGPRDFAGPVKVPEDSYFVMGDNRDYSYDSRFWGFVHMSKIKGLAFIKYWSWDNQQHLPRFNRIGRWIN